MAIRVFELFKIGIGLSSAHTVGPMRAALQFGSGLNDNGLLPKVETIKVDLFGSLGATGKGDGSDRAVMLGLEGEAPESIDPNIIPTKLAQIREAGKLSLLGLREIEFEDKKHLIFHRRQTLSYRSNGMRFTAYDDNGKEIYPKVYYWVGGGFVVNEEAAGADRIKEDDTRLPYPFKSAAELLGLCQQYDLSS